MQTSSQVATQQTKLNLNTEITSWDNGKIGAMKKLSGYIAALQKTLPYSNSNVQTHYVDPQVVAETGLMQSVDSFLDNPPEEALKRIDWYDGFPVVEGSPIWERLEGELVPYYSLFKQYKDLKLAKGTRSLFDLSIQSGVALAVINILKDVYHWKMRAVAFDQFQEDQKCQMRANQVDELQGRHKKMANRLLTQMMDFIESEEAFKSLDAKSALSWFETAAKLERLSLGLDATKPVVGSSGAGNGGIAIQINNGTAGGGNSAFPNDPTMNQQTGAPADEGRALEILKILQQAGAFNPKGEVIEVNSEPVVASEPIKEVAKAAPLMKVGEVDDSN